MWAIFIFLFILFRILGILCSGDIDFYDWEKTHLFLKKKKSSLSENPKHSIGFISENRTICTHTAY